MNKEFNPVDTSINYEESNAAPVADETPKDEAPPVEVDDEQQQIADEVDAEPDDEQDEDSEDSANSDGDEAPAQPKKKGVAKRIDELTREKYEERRRADALEAELKALKGQQQPQQAQQPQDELIEPTLEDFNYDVEKYTKAHAQYVQNKVIQDQERKASQAQTAEKIRSFQAKETAFIAQNPDYLEVTRNPKVPITDEVSKLIIEAENAPDIAYHLGKNIDLAYQIAGMQPVQMAIAIGRISAELSAKPSAQSTPPSPQKPVTKAPPPPRPLTPNSPIKKDPDEMSMKEYMAYRDQQNK